MADSSVQKDMRWYTAHTLAQGTELDIYATNVKADLLPDICQGRESVGFARRAKQTSVSLVIQNKNAMTRRYMYINKVQSYMYTAELQTNIL
jgi:hypothetical protein